MPRIYIMNGPDKGRSYDVKSERITMGRGPENDIQLKDKSISRNHLEIFRKGAQYYLQDLKSKNGTFVDGMRIRSGAEYEIKEGIPIAVGKTFFSLGKAYPEDVLAILDSVDLFKELEGNGDLAIKDRPLTAQKNMELIYKVSNVLMQSLNIKDVLERILNYVMELLKRIDRGVIILVNEQTGQISDVISIYKSAEDDCNMPYSRSIVEQVMKERKPVTMLDTLTEDQASLSDSIKLRRIRSVMCVPLISRQKIRGVIYVDSFKQPHGFRKEDLDLLTALSSPAAVAIENAVLSSTGGRPTFS